MATSSVILDIRANTNRALADFKRFSAQLDNKFLISGLKLDVVRSALGQINREFQKAIGEQGLTAGQSLRAAQNQAAVLLQTFKGFGDEASASITESFSATFNQIAVTAGGTFDDVKKSLAATPWISADLPKEIRDKLGAGVLEFQRDARRAGLGEDFAGMARQFLMGQVNAGDLVQSGDPLKSSIGMRLQQAGGGPSTIADAAKRSRVLLDVLSDPKFRDQITKAAKGAAGFRIILEDLSSTLFNPEKGIFGAVRKVTMAVGDTTTILDETQKLIESIFGKQGTFVLFFEQIKKIFGLEDPLKTVISGIRWLTNQFNRLNTFLQSPQVQQIVGILRTVFTNIQTFATSLSESITTNLEDPGSKINQAGKKIDEFFKNLKENIDKELKDDDSILGLIKSIGVSIGGFFKAIDATIKSGDWDPSKISQSIRGIGKSVRDFIRKIGEEIRSVDVDKQGGFFLDIFTTIVGEVAETLGTAIKEAILVVFSGKGLAVVGGALKVLYEGLSKFFAGLFGGSGPLGAVFGGAAMAGLGILLVRRIRGIFDSILRPIQALRTGGGGVGGFVNRLLGGGGRGGAALDPNARGPASMLGSAQTFNRQVVFYLQKIAACVCGPGGLGSRGGGGGPDLDGPRKDRDGRRRVSSLGGPSGRPEPPSPRGFRGTTGKRARIGRFGSGIAEFGRNILAPRPPAASPAEIPDVRRSFLASRRESARNILGRGSSTAALEAYTESLGGANGVLADLDIDQRREISSRNAREGGQKVVDRYNRRYPKRGFGGVAGKRAGVGRFGNRIAEFGRNIYADVTSSGFDSAGYPIGADNNGDNFDIDFPDQTDSNRRAASDARGRSTRERFNSRYGRGGRRAMLGRGIRGFGKGALIVGGLTVAAAGIGSLFGGGAAKASEIDPATGLPIEQPAQKKMGGGEAFGAIGAKAGEFALMGAALGPKGAAIGAAIGAGVALLDKGVRDGAIKASVDWSKGVLSTVKDFTNGIGKSLQDAGSNTGKFLQSTGDNIGKILQSAGSGVGKFFQSAGSNTGKVLQSTGDNVGKFLQNTGNNISKSLQGTGDNIGKGFQSTGNNINKSFRSAGDNIGRAFQSAGDSISKAASNGIQWIKDGFGSISKWFGDIDWKTVLINALVPGGGATVEGLKGIAEFASKLNIFDGIKSGIDGIKGIVEGIRERLPSWLRGGGGKINYAGANFIGPALAQESRMSGAKALVVNETEFVIPKNGFSTLANLVEQRISPQIASKSSSRGGVSANFNITFNVNGNMGAGNVEELRGPVLAIIKQAWEEASTGIATRGSVV